MSPSMEWILMFTIPGLKGILNKGDLKKKCKKDH